LTAQWCLAMERCLLTTASKTICSFSLIFKGEFL
jgi:hypothetical protein